MKKHKLCLTIQYNPREQVIETKLPGIALVRCHSCLSQSTLKQLVQSLVLTHLNYYPAIWSSAAMKDLQKLQAVQNWAARLVLNCLVRECMLVCPGWSWHFNLPLPLFSRKTFTRNKHDYKPRQEVTMDKVYSTSQKFEHTFLFTWMSKLLISIVYKRAKCTTAHCICD